MRKGVVTAGTWCVDQNKVIAVWPQEDTATEIKAIDRQGGGSGCNMAIDLRRLDPTFPVETIGLVGDDDLGRFLLQQCDALGIDRTQLRIVKNAATQVVDAFCIEGSGRRTHFFYQGVAELLSPDDCDFSACEARILHLGLPGTHLVMDGPWQNDANGWAAALKKARAAGLQTNLELMTIAPERIAALARPCLPYLDLLIVNDFEIGAIAGMSTRAGDVASPQAIYRAIDNVFERGAVQLIVVHFPEGAIAATRDGQRIGVGSFAVPPTAVAGANGAGDAFAAGMLYGWHERWPLHESVTLGHACAAVSMREISTTTGVLPWRDCLAWARQWSTRVF